MTKQDEAREALDYLEQRIGSDDKNYDEWEKTIEAFFSLRQALTPKEVDVELAFNFQEQVDLAVNSDDFVELNAYRFYNVKLDIETCFAINNAIIEAAKFTTPDPDYIRIRKSDLEEKLHAEYELSRGVLSDDKHIYGDCMARRERNKTINEILNTGARDE